MRNRRSLELSPDRQIYDATLKTQEILRKKSFGQIGTAEVLAAIEASSREVQVNPILVLNAIADEQGSKINYHRRSIEASAMHLDLTRADVDRGALAARSGLHDVATSENRLNAEALTVVLAMDKIFAPRADGGGGSPLLDHVKRTLIYLLDFDVSVMPPASGADRGRWEHSVEVSSRVIDFLRIVAQESPRVGGGGPWIKYFDKRFTALEDLDRSSQIHFWVVIPVEALIEQTMAEINGIVTETAIPRRRSATVLHALDVRSLLKRPVVSHRTL
jgi:hypothetical protein